MGPRGTYAAGRNGGTWDGDGLVTTAAGASDYTTLAVAEASDALGIGASQTAIFGGQTVDATAVLVKFTYGGDANLDGQINIDDYGQIDAYAGLNGVVHGWFNGDFNYDGNIDIDDYGIIDGVIGIQGPVL